MGLKISLQTASKELQTCGRSEDPPIHTPHQQARDRGPGGWTPFPPWWGSLTSWANSTPGFHRCLWLSPSKSKTAMIFSTFFPRCKGMMGSETPMRVSAPHTPPEVGPGLSPGHWPGLSRLRLAWRFHARKPGAGGWGRPKGRPSHICPWEGRSPCLSFLLCPVRLKYLSFSIK